MNTDAIGQIDNQQLAYGVRLRNETLQLIEMFTNEYDAKKLADMLHGSWIALKTPNNNPEYLPQVAHSVREFIEKAHDNIVGAPVEVEGGGLKVTVINLNAKWAKAVKNTKTVDTDAWTGTLDSPVQKVLKALGEFFATFSATHRPRGAQHRAVFEKLDGSGQPIPELIAKQRLALWGELDDYFKDVAHHKFIASQDTLEEKIIVLEDFILDMKFPERAVPIDTLNELDTLIAEGNAL